MNRINSLTIIFLLLFSSNLFSQGEQCPDYVMPNPNNSSECVDYDFDDILVLIDDIPCSQTVAPDLNIIGNLMSGTQATSFYINIFLVNQDGSFTNVHDIDNIDTQDLGGNLTPGSGTDPTFSYNTPIDLASLMGFSVTTTVNHFLSDIGACYELVFEFGYTSESGNVCSYFGNITLAFIDTPSGNPDNVCGTLDFADSDSEGCIPGGNGLLPNICATATDECGNQGSLPTSSIFNQACVAVPEDGCVELEVCDCPFEGQNCVTAIDLIELRKLILGITTSTPNNYGGVLANVHGQNVTTLDLVLLQRYILGLEVPTDFPIGECVLLDVNQVNGDPDGLNSTYGGDFTFSVCDGDEDFNLVLGVLGDVDGSCGCEEAVTFNEDDQTEELIIFEDTDDGQLLFANDIAFYDLAINLQLTSGQINSFLAATQFTSSEQIDVSYQITERGITIAYSSLTDEPVYFESGESLLNLGNVSFEINRNNSHLITSELDLYIPQKMTSQVGRRNTTLEKTIRTSIISTPTAINLSSEADFLNSEIQVYTTDGKRLYFDKIMNSQSKYQIPLVSNNQLLFVTIKQGHSVITEKIIH